MLTQTVTNNSAIGNGGTWADPSTQNPANIPTACHFATVYWLFLDEFKRVHSQDEAVTLGNAQLVVGELIAHGARKRRPAQGGLMLTAGSVLIFVDKNSAKHSCVAIGPQTVGGYNQMSWYSAGGANHGYSTHPTSQLMWASATQVRRVQGSGTFDLYEVPESTAKAVIRGLVQP